MTEFEEIMFNRLGESWFKVLQNDINSEYFKKLAREIAYYRQSMTIYPEPEDVFKAYKLSPFDKTKVVIIGQDPYYDGSADGLCFSYKDGKRPQGKKKSLDVIFKELEDDVKFGMYLSQDYDLTWLAEQGVFLLNTILTVRRNQALSHKGKGWENFTGKSIAVLAANSAPKVFMLWGNEAQNAFDKSCKFFNVTVNGHLVLRAKHPAADLYNADSFGDIKPNYPNTFLGCKHFSEANSFLKYYYNEEITW